jgi:hypothetical protein
MTVSEVALQYLKTSDTIFQDPQICKSYVSDESFFSGEKNVSWRENVFSLQRKIIDELTTNKVEVT